jgi:hypothetical protein
MITIDFSNIEKLIFWDIELQNKFPEFKELFDKWKLGLSAPSLRPIAQKALIDLLNQLDDEYVRILESHFGTTVEISKIDHTLIRSYKIPLLDAQDHIKCWDFSGEMFLHRDANHLYIGFWR